MKRKKRKPVRVREKTQQHTAGVAQSNREKQTLEEALGDMSIVHELNLAVARGDSLNEIFSTLATKTKKTFNSFGATVYTLSPNKRFLTLLYTPTITKIIKSLRSTFNIPVPGTITIPLHKHSHYDTILRQAVPVIIQDEKAIEEMIRAFTDDPALQKLAAKIYQFLHIKSVMCAPLIVKNEPIGIIDISRKIPFSDYDLKRFMFIAQGVVSVLTLRKSQKAYDEGRELFTEFVNTADQGFIFCDGNLNITNVNNYILDRFSIDRNDIIGMNIVDLNLGALESGRYHAYLKVLQTGEPITFDRVPTPPEFGECLLRIKACRIGDNLILVVDDITEQYMKEQHLRDSETAMRSIIENQTELICRFTPDKKLTFVNTAYCEYFSKSKWELIGSSFINLIKENDREFVIAEIDKLSIDNPVGKLEERVILPDGSIRWQQWINRAVFDETGTIIEYQSVGRDITDLKTGTSKNRKDNSNDSKR